MNKGSSVITFLILILLIFSTHHISADIGDTREEAKVAVLGENTGTIDNSNGAFWFSFEANESVSYAISLFGPSDTDFDANIEDENGSFEGGIYGSNYPDSEVVYGENLYYIRVYSAYGFGDFTLNITESRKGATSNDPYIISEGDNVFNTTGLIRDNFYGYFNNYTVNTYFQFELILLTNETYGSLYLYGQYSENAFNDTRYPDEAEAGEVLGTESGIYLNLYFGSYEDNQYLEFNIRVTEISPPDGIGQFNAYDLQINQTTQIELLDGRYIYGNISIEDGNWYSFQVDTNSSIGINVRYYDENGYWINSDYVSRSTTLYHRGEIQTISLAFRAYDNVNISVTPSRNEPPAGYSEDNPVTLQEGQEVSTEVIGDRVYFEADVTIGESYLFSVEFPWNVNNGFRIEARDSSYLPSFSYSGNTGSYYFEPRSDSITIELDIYNDENTNLTALLEVTDKPPHSTKEDAMEISVGDTDTQITYPGQRIYFEFPTERGIYYNFLSENYYYDLEIFDEYGQQTNAETDFAGTGSAIYIMIYPDYSTNIEFTISEVPEPDRLRYDHYSEHFREGDYLEYEVALETTGTPPITHDLNDGDRVRIDILENSPILSELDFDSKSFGMTVNDQIGNVGSLNNYILPTKIERRNGNVLQGEEIIHDLYWSDLIEKNGDSYIITFEDEDRYADYTAVYRFEIIIDVTTHMMRSIEIYESGQHGSYQFNLDLVESRISGPPSSPEEDKPPFSVPFQGFTSLVGLGILVIFYNKSKEKSNQLN